ncbi:DUF4192 domain-containing protein [Cryobacterium sp. TMT1-3]|uniref:DUF4192 domain-containing protein n=1 Tax=Cryobacterium luteum TaxID=1424661 RepID=A0A1H8FQI9_9MICO|nr:MULTISPECIES: DUF4192 domain-containing protein [Cryobacterium]TFB93424.1 DUF4192 domain-containing protein [Cryobacterium luteum]TFC28856.1 DUF4192 domain-containing protein [Cryobacterium sp. TMT1-3]SEN33517.1 protein of unknown function [Cryobacterium luteum]
MHPTIVKAQKAQDFLALVPQLLGFVPETSVVLVAFRGNRTCGALRFNLPDDGAPHKVYKRIATTLAGMLCKIPGVDAAVPVIYTADAFGGTPGIPRERFAEILNRRLELSGFLLRDSLCVAADAWGSYLDPGCPAGGRPLSDIAESPIFEAVDQESAAQTPRPLGTLQNGADPIEVSLAARERLARIYRRYRHLLARAENAPELFPTLGFVLDPVATAEAALTWPNPPTEEDAAALLVLVQGPPNRDQIMVQFAFGRAEGVRAHEMNHRYARLQDETGRSLDDLVTEEFSTGEPTAKHTSDIMLGLQRERPDVDRIRVAITLLRTVVAMAPRSAKPAPLCMLAWLSWALGSGSVAGQYVDQALAIDSHYSMATLLDLLLRSGHLPEWAFAVPRDDGEEGDEHDEYEPDDDWGDDFDEFATDS